LQKKHTESISFGIDERRYIDRISGSISVISELTVVVRLSDRFVVPPDRRTVMLCVGYFERRVGRTLVMGDFATAA